MCAFYDKVEALAKTCTRASEVAFGWEVLSSPQHCHAARFLDVALDMRKFRLPKDIVEYDQWLDKQAEELHKQQALKHGQGRTMITSSEWTMDKPIQTWYHLDII